MTKCSTLSYDGQKIFCGFDVHSTQWHVCIRSNGVQLKCFRTDSDYIWLIDWLKQNFPGAEIHSVYEAGFCGFSAHRAFLAAGIHNIVINPADVPTTGKERVEKNDRTDCCKLARHLESGSLTPINVPDRKTEYLRGLVRNETQVRDLATQVSNQLKSALHFHGCNAVPRRLSEKMLESLKCEMEFELEQLDMHKEEDQERFAYCHLILSKIRTLRMLRLERRQIIAQEREAIARLGLTKSIECLTSVCGIAFRSAVVILSELGDIRRFKGRNQLASYVGLAPHAYGSGESERDRASGNRKQKQLHYLFMQAAWVAVSRDRAMFSYFGHLVQKRKLKKTRAIVSVAKKILMIIHAVLRDQKPYNPEEIFQKNARIQRLDTDGKFAIKCREEAERSPANEEDTLMSCGEDTGLPAENDKDSVQPQHECPNSRVPENSGIEPQS